VQIQTTIIQRKPALQTALSELSGSLAVDTEFHAEHRFHPELMWIQIADETGRVLLIDGQKDELVLAVQEELQHHALLFHAGVHDLALLDPERKIVSKQVFDTQIAAGLLGLGYPRRLDHLLLECIHCAIQKSEGLSNWAARPLSDAQIQYASNDVAHLHRLAEQLKKTANIRGWSSFESVVSELVFELNQPSDENHLWQEFNAAKTLDGMGRDVLRRLCIWRHRRAKDLEKRPRQICPDGILVDISKRKPESLLELSSPRNFPKKLRKELGEDILKCVRSAKSADPSTHPQPIVESTQQTSIEFLLSAWAHAFEDESGISPRLLLPTATRRSLAQQWIHGEAPSFKTPWRQQCGQTALDGFYQGNYQIGPSGLKRD